MRPILASTANACGIAPAEMARASLFGQSIHLLSRLMPLLDIHHGDSQKPSSLRGLGRVLALRGGALLFGAIPFVSRV